MSLLSIKLSRMFASDSRKEWQRRVHKTSAIPYLFANSCCSILPDMSNRPFNFCSYLIQHLKWFGWSVGIERTPTSRMVLLSETRHGRKEMTVNLRTMNLSERGVPSSFSGSFFSCSNHVFIFLPLIWQLWGRPHSSAQDNQLGMGRSAALRRHRPRIPKAKVAVIPYTWEYPSKCPN